MVKVRFGVRVSLPSCFTPSSVPLHFGTSSLLAEHLSTSKIICMSLILDHWKSTLCPICARNSTKCSRGPCVLTVRSVKRERWSTSKVRVDWVFFFLPVTFLTVLFRLLASLCWDENSKKHLFQLTWPKLAQSNWFNLNIHSSPNNDLRACQFSSTVRFISTENLGYRWAFFFFLCWPHFVLHYIFICSGSPGVYRCTQ